jgi:hypothetical protein
MSRRIILAIYRFEAEERQTMKTGIRIVGLAMLVGGGILFFAGKSLDLQMFIMLFLILLQLGEKGKS